MESLRVFLKSRHDKNLAALAQFAKDFEADPRHALEWGLPAFAAAAMLPHTRHLAEMDRVDMTPAMVKSYLRRRLHEKARRLSGRSSHATDSLLMDYEVSGLAQLLDDMRGFE